MTRSAIVDTGPLVAYFDRRERHHAWVVAQLQQLAPPLLVCEPVLTETLFLLSRHPAAQDGLMDLLQRGALRLAFNLGEHLAEVRALLRRYRTVPMSLADACLVRMAEVHGRHHVLTLDADFRVYRKNGRDPLPILLPEGA